MAPSKRRENYDGPHDMNRADRRKSINILVMGDAMVGKSSLISTFVSRVFMPDVPGIMTRVQLPSDPSTRCTTTIIDSQQADSALMEALEKRGESLESSLTSSSSSSDHAPVSLSLDAVDSIVLVYDLVQPESFRRVEDHWLPLLQQYYQGSVPIIIAENKVDLFDTDLVGQKRQQIVSLMQRFPSIRQCIKCSAISQSRVDDVWFKAQQAVIYPLSLYDLEKGELSSGCQRALRRIFRMYDRDGDGLLSGPELDRFERDTYPTPVFLESAELQKIVSRRCANAVEDSKFTPDGFLAIFDVFVSQNRLDVVWQALRRLGYDDDLQLYIPPDLPVPKKLSSNAKKFLAALFQQFDSNHDGILSSDDVWRIFSIISSSHLPPWNPNRAVFQECFTAPVPSSSGNCTSSTHSSASQHSQLIVPGDNLGQSLSSSGLSALSVSDSLPSLDFQPSVSFWEWMGYWHAMYSISPRITVEELYRLGFSENRRPVKLKNKLTKSRAIRIWVWGATKARTALLQRLSGASVSDERPETCVANYCMTRANGEEVMVHLIMTNIPHHTTTATSDFDLAMLVFDEKPSSWSYLQTLTTISSETPRVYVTQDGVAAVANEHCRHLDVEPPMRTEWMDNDAILRHLTRCGWTCMSHSTKDIDLVDRLRSIPWEEKKRRTARQRQRMLWLGVGVVVVVGVGLFIKRSNSRFWLWWRPQPRTI